MNLEKTDQVGASKNPVAADPADAFEAADQIAGGNVPLQRVNVHAEQPGGGDGADRGAVGKGARESGILGHVKPTTAQG